MHLHVRQGDVLQAVVPQTARVFGRAIIMPNILPPVTTAERVEKYRARVEQAARPHSFTPLMTFKIMPGMSPDTVGELKKAGVLAGKLYPEGATTNSEDGVADVKAIYPVLELMQQHDIVLSIHGEVPAAFSLDREAEFLPILLDIRRKFPRLRIVLEHLTSAAAVEAVQQLDGVAGTITLHHLELTLDDLLGGELNPHFFCKPIVKRPADRAALQKAAMSGSPKFFFGSDSAPHPIHRKHAPAVRAGVFSAPVAFNGLLRFFLEHEAINKLEDFTSRFGAEFYGLPLNTQKIIAYRSDYIVPDDISGIVPYHAGVCFPYQFTVG